MPLLTFLKRAFARQCNRTPRLGAIRVGPRRRTAILYTFATLNCSMYKDRDKSSAEAEERLSDREIGKGEGDLCSVERNAASERRTQIHLPITRLRKRRDRITNQRQRCTPRSTQKLSNRSGSLTVARTRQQVMQILELTLGERFLIFLPAAKSSGGRDQQRVVILGKHRVSRSHLSW